jgi:Serine/threonine protein kinase
LAIENERHFGLLSTRFHIENRDIQPFSTPSDMRPVDSAVMVQLREGDVIGGYKLIDLIGHGGMGLVFRCEHVALNRICALKCVAPSMVSQSSKELFQKEAKIAGALKHSAICQIYDLGMHSNGLPYYAMEYLPGKTLSEVLIEEGPLSVGAVVEIFLNVAKGLAYAHSEGIIHKDIKPANIMLDVDEAGGISSKILDFGIAELVSRKSSVEDDVEAGLRTVDTKPDTASAAKQIVGTALYMSPEQFVTTSLDCRSDIYSVGCTIFEALTGQVPYSGDSRDVLAAKHATAPIPSLSTTTGIEFPAAVEAIVRKALEKLPENRYESADQLVRDFQLFLEDLPLEFAEGNPSEIGSEKFDETHSRSSTKTFSIALACMVFALLGVAVLFASLPSPDKTRSPAQDKKSQNRRSMASQTVRKREGPASASENEAPVPAHEKEVLAPQQLKEAILSIYSAYRKKQYRDVIEKTDKLIGKGNEIGDLYIYRGASYFNMEEPKIALQDLEKGIELKPALKTEFVSELLARCYVAQKQPHRALAEITDNLEKYKPDSERFKIRAQILFGLGRFREAVDSYDKSIQIRPDFWSYVEQGQCYAEMNQHKRAVEDFTKAIELSKKEGIGNEKRVYEKRAKSYISLGKTDLARADLDRCKKFSLSDFSELGGFNTQTPE